MSSNLDDDVSGRHLAAGQEINTGEFWGDVIFKQKESAESRHNVSFCGEDELVRSVETKLFLHQFYKMYESGE